MLALRAAMQLPLTATDADDDLELVGSVDVFAGFVCLLHQGRKRDVVDIEKAIDAEIPEEEAGEVLITFLGVDDAVVPGMTPMHKRPR